MDDQTLDVVGEKLNRAAQVLMVTHIRPDGDAIGSLLGLGLSLQNAGKQVQMVLDDGIPPSLRHLSGCEQIRRVPEGAFDLIVALDCSDISRVGKALNGYRAPDVNIDHHVTNEFFGSYNLVDLSASATAEMLAEYLPRWQFPITKEIASALLTGVITDTLGFRTSNVTSKTLRLAADLIDHGAEISELTMRSLVERSFEALRFWGAGLKQMEREGPIVWTILTQEDRINAGYSGRDDADLISVLSTVKDASVAIIFVEQPNGSVKVSWRAQPGIDVTRVAMLFGGGGHPAAAGAEVPGKLDEVFTKVLKETQELLVNQHV